jgi:signal transduction histidine kinase
LFDIRAQEKSIVIERRFDPNVGKMFKIFMDQRGIHTCLSNLVSNAIDACEMDQKDTEHRIVVGTNHDVDGNLIFEVADNGSGMDEDTKHKVFSSFFSTKGTRGTGLGLLVTSKIVMEHGGEISFASEPAVGTAFTIKLPPGQKSRSRGGSLRPVARDNENLAKETDSLDRKKLANSEG